MVTTAHLLTLAAVAISSLVTPAAAGVNLKNYWYGKCSGDYFQCTNIKSGSCCGARQFRSGSCQGCNSGQSHALYKFNVWFDLLPCHSYDSQKKGGSNNCINVGDSYGAFGHKWKGGKFKRDTESLENEEDCEKVQPDLYFISGVYFGANETTTKEQRDLLDDTGRASLKRRDIPELLKPLVLENYVPDDDLIEYIEGP